MGLIIGTKSGGGGGSISLDKLKELFETLPDGQAVSAQVALNTLQLQGLQGLQLSEYGNGDLAIADGQGNILVRFADGHIETKNFNSRKLQGKKFSFIGDSISTMRGWLPSDRAGYSGAAYATHYPHPSVETWEDTWWGKLSKMSGMVIGQNCAWSGSTCCGDSASNTTALAACSNKRIADLALNGTPDIIICYIGINDMARNKIIGNWDGTQPIVADGTIDNFSQAYSLMVSKIMNTYKYADVFCCTLIESAAASVDVVDNRVFPAINANGDSIWQYNEKINTIAKSLGANVIDLHSCGITFFNFDQFMWDGHTHPNGAGQSLMANKIYAELLAKTNKI